jgi:hypothetical protein
VVPADTAGITTVISVDETTVTNLAADSTAVLAVPLLSSTSSTVGEPKKPDPVIVRPFPPAELTAGAEVAEEHDDWATQSCDTVGRRSPK